MRVREIEELFYHNEIGRIADSMNDGDIYQPTYVNTDVCVSKCPLCAFNNRKGYLP